MSSLPILGPSGRPLRVLHVGNIANNAYYAAKLQRRAGVEADVLCYDLYWVMSSPEWEEADFAGVPADQIHPDWDAIDLGGYQRPRWFAQGPLEACVTYLRAKQRGDPELEAHWARLEAERRRASAELRLGGATAAAPSPETALLTRTLRKLRRMLAGPRTRRIKREAGALIRRARILARRTPSSGIDEGRVGALIADFARRFPERRDRLQEVDFAPFLPKAALLRELFRGYDVIQSYALDPLYPMLLEQRPYVAFEHGTLRDSPEVSWAFKGPFFDNALGRLTALSYARADHVFITNADCLGSARRLGIPETRFQPMPHPFDDQGFVPNPEQEARIKRELGVEHLFLCPIRHDWEEKGTDRYIRALPALRAQIPGRFKVCFMPWGREIERSRALVEELGVGDLVEWVGPFGRVHFARWISAADAIYDQLVYTSFSGVGPRAMACGAAVIAAYDPAEMAWMFPEPAPILSARSVEDVVRRSVEVVSPGFRERHRREARAWVERNHSSELVLRRMLDVYQRLLAPRVG